MQDWVPEQRVSIHAFRGEGDLLFAAICKMSSCFNPRLPGGRRLACAALTALGGGVSIHAFRGEGDLGGATFIHTGSLCFNPRLPGGRRPGPPSPLSLPSRFNPRLPGGRRHFADNNAAPSHLVSIHAFRGEGDHGDDDNDGQTFEFQSTPSGGKATDGAGRIGL